MIIGLAVTREGIPVRVWCWPGNTSDVTVLPEVRDGMRDWKLGRVVTVVDRGFSSNANLDYLRRGGGHWIAGERMRDHAGDAAQALSRQGRFTVVNDHLHVKEAKLDSTPGVRWIICLNTAEAVKDKTTRDEAVTRLEAELARIGEARAKASAALKTTSSAKTRSRLEAELAGHTRTECALRDHVTLGRWLRQTPTGRLVIDRARIAAEAKLDGKYLLSTSDPHLTPGAGRPGLQEPARGRTRVPRHEVHPDAAPGVPPPRTPDPGPRPDLLAGPAAGPGRRERHRHHLGPDRPTSWTASPRSPSPGPPGPSSRPPSPPTPNAPFLGPATSPRHPGSPR